MAVYGEKYAWVPAVLEVVAGDQVTFSWTLPDQDNGPSIGVYTTADALSKSHDDNGFKKESSASGKIGILFRNFERSL